MRWFKLPEKSDGETQPHPHIKNTDTCYYAREYKTGDKNFKPNQLIYDFKRSLQSFPKGESISDLRDKEEVLKNNTKRKKAIEQISKEIAELFKSDGIYTITAMPSSKIKTDLEYDNRFEDLFEELLKLRPYLEIEESVENKKTIQDTKRGGSRYPDSIKANYIWKGWRNSPEEIIIIDDVLTTGTHFRAISDFLEDNGYRGEIVGLFLARTHNPEYNK